MSNRLAAESSPYLLQHADNPVDWYPWGQEALVRAEQEDKPILLSIGYAACHWCHVMAHESFEDEETASYMNEHFINIKVDREERPDLDGIYMAAVQAITGQGGWPMTVALMPDGRPFYGGTYFPPNPRFGMPSFRQVLQSIVSAWNARRGELEESADKLTSALNQDLSNSTTLGTLQQELLGEAERKASESFDARLGGFGGAPKFPPSMTLEFLLRKHLGDNSVVALEMVEKTLQEMARGGMYDQLGGGFARYATDAAWLVPHFEKMLYDNALLSRVYLHAWQVTGKPLYRRITEETLEFVARELRQPDGGFYSSYDADSEGEEGKFYVWSLDEVIDALGDDAELFARYFDVSATGNWEGKNILNIPLPLEDVALPERMGIGEAKSRLLDSRRKLLQVRSERQWPGLDDKILTSWNGLMMASFAEAGRALERPDFTETAAHNARFLYKALRTDEGRLLRTWKAGSEAKYNAYLEDYAYLADGLLALYQTTFDERWFRWALELGETMIDYFKDDVGAGFYDTSVDHESLIRRPKELQDNAVPSGNAMAAEVFLRLSLFTGNSRYWEIAEAAITSIAPYMARFPTAFAHWLGAATLVLGEPQEIAIVGIPERADFASMLSAVHRRYRPHLVVAAGPPGDSIPLLAGREAPSGKATAYICRRFVCDAPVQDVELLSRRLGT